MSHLNERVHIVTGGGSGIGRATARLLANRGARVAVMDIDATAAGEVVEEITASGAEAMVVRADVSSEDDVKAGVAAVAAQWGRIDVLYNNAALLNRAQLDRDGRIEDLALETWEAAMAVNLRGAMLCTKHVIPYMRARGGSIIMSGSGKGLQGDLDHTAYGVSKAGLVALMRYAATQYGKDGIRVNLVMIGLVLSEPIAAALPAERKALYERHHLTPRLGRPEDIAEVVAFLASDASAFVTGQVIGADGGYTAHSPIYADQWAQRTGS